MAQKGLPIDVESFGFGILIVVTDVAHLGKETASGSGPGVGAMHSYGDLASGLTGAWTIVTFFWCVFEALS